MCRIWLDVPMYMRICRGAARKISGRGVACSSGRLSVVESRDVVGGLGVDEVRVLTYQLQAEGLAIVSYDRFCEFSRFFPAFSAHPGERRVDLPVTNLKGLVTRSSSDILRGRKGQLMRLLLVELVEGFGVRAIVVGVAKGERG